MEEGIKELFRKEVRLLAELLVIIEEQIQNIIDQKIEDFSRNLQKMAGIAAEVAEVEKERYAATYGQDLSKEDDEIITQLKDYARKVQEKNETLTLLLRQELAFNQFLQKNLLPEGNTSILDRQV
ncbi:flagellar export chaperone FlgN [Carboxydothermus ferrireducens]|uniref:NanoRNase/pAp phosphatase (C-di-AMP/oligoRNAs hydrolase) n=1 Tax=Carboxydothermus ferrireducens DSM 11255 TaxID=1119529 RepID=A0ABX2RAK0_9THEO|nr:flagellar export chaperone FlgN [Carboxydothermus ferrireducens]NYE56875.1 nanoRNase/pAp phosphatase (c-di-AMP/oligoRNAs hydrolase) [Carboxydothermus ferrireducens DSM 11255]